nr:MAG TPA: hypothetical protein [Bacteriophage sp.]
MTQEQYKNVMTLKVLIQLLIIIANISNGIVKILL